MEDNKKSKNGKKVVIGVVVGIVIVLLIGIIIFLALQLNDKQDNENNNIATTENETKNTESKETETKTNQTKSLSFKQMDYTDDSLTEDQKVIAKFFDEDYFFIYSYEEVVRYADMLKNMNISCYAQVNSILSSDSENFEAVCQWGNASDSFYDVGDTITEPIIIKGKKPQKMVIKGDMLTLRGKLIGAETRNINGENKYLPVIEVVEMGENGYWYSEDTIRKVAKLVFGNDIKVRRPTDDENFKMVREYFYEYEDFIWLVEFENQSNLNFQVFDIWQSFDNGLITYNAMYSQGVEKDYLNKKLYITPDLQKYIVFDMSRKDKYVYINVYNRDLKKLWSKEISNASQITWDGTNGSLVFVSDNDLYNINIETGEDIFNPIFVGKRQDVRIIDNGFILLSKDSDDAVMILDENGNIKNKYDINFDSSFEIYNTSIQELDDKYVILYSLQNTSGRNASYKSKYIIIDQNGNKLSESE